RAGDARADEIEVTVHAERRRRAEVVAAHPDVHEAGRGPGVAGVAREGGELGVIAADAAEVVRDVEVATADDMTAGREHGRGDDRQRGEARGQAAAKYVHDHLRRCDVRASPSRSIGAAHGRRARSSRVRADSYDRARTRADALPGAARPPPTLR